MLPQTKAKMYLSKERELFEADWMRSYNTFRYEGNADENKLPFGAVYKLGDEVLQGEKTLLFTTETCTDIIIIPVIGAVIYSDSIGNTDIIEAGAAMRYTVPAGTTINIFNPFKNELVNFLQVWLKHGLNCHTTKAYCEFNLDKNANKLLQLFNNSNDKYQCCFKFYIGKFSGREETVLNVSKNRGLFAFVLQGAFELQYRLIEARDGLALYDPGKAELEALSNEAIILIIETSLSY